MITPDHAGSLKHGSILGPPANWVECSCGWIGRATTDEGESWRGYGYHIAQIQKATLGSSAEASW
jgi:hypothetical protein